MRGVEFVPSDDFCEDVKILQSLFEFFKPDFVLIPDNPLGKPSISSIVSAKMLGDALGVKTIATIGAGGKSREYILSLIKGAKYANLAGIACVSGDKGAHEGALEVLDMTQEYKFDFKITTTQNLAQKITMGATHAITQPIFQTPILASGQISIFANFMPIFSHSTFSAIAKNQEILGFEIPKCYQDSSDLMVENTKLLEMILSSHGNLYLTPINLAKQLPYLKELFARSKSKSSFNS